MNAIGRPKLSHVGISVHDLHHMREFYCGVFGFVVSDEGCGTAMPVKLVFLTADPEMHHQLVLAAGRPADATFSTVNQLSFTVADLDELRNVKQRLIEHGASDVRGISHGNAWSIYVKDPELNTIEVYLDTPFYVPQPHFDLSLTDDEILEQTRKACELDAGFMLREDWQQRIARQLEKAF